MNANHRSRRPNKGFTLAELLTVLAVLCIMASFSIPKILIATQEKITIQKYKTVISELSSLCYQAWQEDVIHNQDDVENYLKTHLNYVAFNDNLDQNEFVMQNGIKFRLGAYFTDAFKINQQFFYIEMPFSN